MKKHTSESIDTPILLLEEMAAVLKVEPDWLQRSNCPRVRIGHTVRYHRAVGINWMVQHIDSDLAKHVVERVA